jgi:hypothetical protein
MITIFRTLLLASFAIWFGGFGFYASIVVPIGTEVLGSSLNQGMITRQVTVWINVFSGIALAMMFLESCFSWKRLSKELRSTQLALCLLMGVALLVLVYLHPMLDSMIDVPEVEVTDEARFYPLHRVYLWVSTIQWAAAWVWLLVLMMGWRKMAGR